MLEQQPERAAREYLGILYLAARESEAGVEAVLEQLLRSGGPWTAAVVEQGPVSGPAELLPIQRWFFATGGSDWHHDNQHALLPVDPATAPAASECSPSIRARRTSISRCGS